jgi:glyoxylate reductase
MRILYSDPQPHGDMEALGGQRVDLARLLGESDIVTIHVPLAPGTRHLIGAGELAKMKATAVLVNTSRGPVIDEAALVESLRGGRIGAAGLDVYEDEPRPAPGLVECRNAVLLPHIGSATHQARTKMSTLAAGNILAALAGRRPGNLVNPKAWREMP